ncbi:MAG: hypothetical protein QW057_01810 [Candidatus Bathyarchaeia archaeon]
MTQEPKLKAHVVFGEAYMDVEGSPDEVFESLVRFLSKVYPSLEIAQRLTFNPDIAELANALAGVVEIAQEGPLITSSKPLAAKHALILALTGAYVGERLGVLEKGTLTAQQLKTATGKASKTVMNQLPKMIEEGIVEKLKKGEYRITQPGLRQSQTIAQTAKTT